MDNTLGSALRDMDTPRICVVGDFMLDTYVQGQVNRVSPEAPIPVLDVDEKSHRPGGAGSVVTMLRALDADVSCVGTVGEDTAARELRTELGNLGATVEGLLCCKDRPTTLKTRYMGYVHSAGRGMRQIVRVDQEVTEPIGRDVARNVRDEVQKQIPHADLLLIQDMAKGLLDVQLLQELISDASEHDLPVIVDPDREKDYAGYRGASCILPNRQEAQNATGIELTGEEDYRKAARNFVENLDLQCAVITLDREGMFYRTEGGEEHHVSTKPRSVLDVTGAGDMVAAVMSLGLATGMSPHQSVRMANTAAGLEVSRQGATPITRIELLAELDTEFSPSSRKIKDRTELQDILNRHRERGESIAFTNGVFDLLHLGHVELIRFTSRQADCTVVALNSDSSVRQIKGPSRPINPEDIRAQTVASMSNVDYVVTFDEPSVLPLIKELRPDVLVKGGDYEPSGVVGYDFVTSYGGQVKLAPQVEGLSTTELIRRIQEGGR